MAAAADDDDEGLARGFVAFYLAFACVALLLTAGACALIARWGDFRFSVTRLMVVMHVTLLLQQLFSMPFAFSWSDGVCTAAAFFRAYFGLSNAVATSFLMLFFYISHRGNAGLSISISSFMRQWSVRLIVLFPLITLLPLSTGTYGRSDEHWCRFQSGRPADRLWEVFAYNLWAILAVAGSGAMILRSIRAVCKIHADIGGRLMASLGAYSLTALLCWAVRVAVNLWDFSPARRASHAELAAVEDTITQTMGICYAFILFRDVSMVLDMRSGSEIFSNSSIVSTSILNWEGIVDQMGSRTSAVDRETVVTNPAGRCSAVSGNAEL